MRTALLALFVSLGLIGILTLGSLFGYDLRIAARPQQATTSAGVPGLVGRPAQLIPVPSGTFKGPTGQPSVRGPSAPPPEE